MFTEMEMITRPMLHTGACPLYLSLAGST